MKDKSKDALVDEITRLNGVINELKLELKGVNKKVGMDITKVNIVAGSLLKAQERLDHLKADNGLVAIEAESIKVYVTKALELIREAQGIHPSHDIADDLPPIYGLHVHDYIFNEFKADSNERTVTVNGETYFVPQSEFNYLLELMKQPNRAVTFSNSAVTRTTIGRLKNRVPLFKDLIKSIFGKHAYCLKVTPISK